MAKKPEDRRKLLRNILILLLIGALLTFNILFIIGSVKYRVLRIRFNTSYVQDTDYTLEAVYVAEEVLDTEGDTWYYEIVGGFYNYKDIADGTDDHQLLLAFSERLLIETATDEFVLIAYGIRESDSTRVNITTTPTRLFDAGRVILNNIDFDLKDIDFDYIAMWFLAESFFGNF